MADGVDVQWEPPEDSRAELLTTVMEMLDFLDEEDEDGDRFGTPQAVVIIVEDEEGTTRWNANVPRSHAGGLLFRAAFNTV